MIIDGKEYVKTGTKPLIGDLVYVTKINSISGIFHPDLLVKIIDGKHGAYKMDKVVDGEQYINNKFDEFYVVKEVQPTHEKTIKTKIGNFENEEHTVYYPTDEEKCKSILDEYEKQLEKDKHTTFYETPSDSKQYFNDTRPAHYHAGGIDVFKYIRANMSIEEMTGYHKATAIKYVIRAGKKDPILKDFKKAREHLDEIIDVLEEAEYEG